MKTHSLLSRIDLRAFSLVAWAALVLALVAAACGDDDEPNGDAGTDAAISDAETPDIDAGTKSDGGMAAPFGPCKSDADCPNNTFCDREIPGMISVSGAPGGGMIDQSLFPGGSCSPRPLAMFDSMGACDSSLPQASQGCGKNGACVLESLNDDTYAACRAACEPSATSSGCARPGYTCDFGLHACIEGCRSDAECRILVQDTNGDGVADALGYDRESQAVCDDKTSRCTHPGSASVPVGSSCERLDDCAPDATCLDASRTLGGLDFPGGFCTAVGCDVKGRECSGQNTVCEALRPQLGSVSDAPLCLVACEIGSEPEADRLGKNGHGKNCRPGYRCHYNGGSGAGSGVCAGGVYNDVKDNNIGKACTSDAECYSPYGYGVCLQYTATSARIRASTGTCSILDCAVPGLPDDICGAGNECIPFSGDLTFCIHNCASANDCAAGYACVDEDEDPSTAKICFPACIAQADCRSSERCMIASGAGAGRCVAR
ncbi:MAG TPA: hypothetical protein VJR89_06125 [Polyangiales bacterium]|nr:hypothetical protein [Polyangiales bacterium]